MDLIRYKGNWILSFVSLRKGPWSGFTKKTKIALRSVFFSSSPKLMQALLLR